MTSMLYFAGFQSLFSGIENVYSGFSMDFLTSLLILLFGILVLMPIPVFLRPDKNIQESLFKTWETVKPYYIMSKKSEDTLKNSTSNEDGKTAVKQDSKSGNDTRSDDLSNKNPKDSSQNTLSSAANPSPDGKNGTSEGKKEESGKTSETTGKTNGTSNNSPSGNPSTGNPSTNNPSSDKPSADPSKPLDTADKKPDANQNPSTPTNNQEDNKKQVSSVSTVTETLPPELTTIVQIQTHVSTSTVTNTITSTVTDILTKIPDGISETVPVKTVVSPETTIPTETVNPTETTIFIETAIPTETTIPTETIASATPVTTSESETLDIHHDGVEGTKNKGLFGEGSLIAILIPLTVFIIVFIVLVWFWCRRRRRFSRVPLKQAGNYKITPIINESSEGIQRTNYSEKDQSYNVEENDFNKGGYRGWGSVGTPINKASSRNQSLSSANVSPAYQKQEYFFPKNNTEKESKLNTPKNEPRNSKSFESKNLQAQFFNNGKNSNYSTSPYSLNSQNTMDSFGRNAALLDYDSNVAKENYANKLYSYSDVPRSLSTNYGRFSENRRNGFLRQNPSTFNRSSEKSEMPDFLKNP
ncbi:hypothetical protein T552_02754 [Pneumocystis carinii B80]|uniref:Uncharacterized protein n=1 Tax=Pneumocystis carinii (strain B80) TaxID=1408658 RepID=A0A0W4ZEH6_PNEC8|nr:hypothetical protein T552_02754 [Pneumocystis carinii B80]KTW26750.1 hypothetical protein T552_02754 [Pneumocystis carinii B80]